MRQSRGGAKITPHIVNGDVELHSNHFTCKLVRLNHFFDGPIACASLPGIYCTSGVLAVMLHSILKVMNQWHHFRPRLGHPAMTLAWFRGCELTGLLAWCDLWRCGKRLLLVMCGGRRAGGAGREGGGESRGGGGSSSSSHPGGGGGRGRFDQDRRVVSRVTVAISRERRKETEKAANSNRIYFLKGIASLRNVYSMLSIAGEEQYSDITLFPISPHGWRRCKEKRYARSTVLPALFTASYRYLQPGTLR